MIESCEHYAKQSWRNRCRIYAADGAQTLSYPVVHEDFGKPISRMRIDWKTDWLTRHERAIVSAYNTSPYFEYYRDELFAILESRPALMLDLNTEILMFLLRKTGIPAEIRFTAGWTAPAEDGGVSRGQSSGTGDVAGGQCSCTGGVPVKQGFSGTDGGVPSVTVGGKRVTDLREVIHPKRPNTILRDLGLDRPYWQVFASRFGFIGGLSAMDLLFNEGPESIAYLR